MGDWHPRQGPGGGGLTDWGQAATAHFHGSGSPVGVVTPGGIGDLYVDDTGPGLWQATGLTSADWSQVGGGGSQTVKTATVNVTSAELLAIGSSAKVLIPAPASGTAIVPCEWTAILNYMTTPYAFTGSLAWAFGGSVARAGGSADALTNMLQATGSQIAYGDVAEDFLGEQTYIPLDQADGMPLVLTGSGSSPTDGDSDLLLVVSYFVVPTTAP